MIELRVGQSRLVTDVKKSIALGEKRDFLPDIQQYMLDSGIKYRFEFEQGKLDNKPTVFAANHFRRNLLDRLSVYPTHMFGNTRESLILAGFISVGAERISAKSSSWLVKEDVDTKKIGPITLMEASMQPDFIKTFDHIAIPNLATRDTPGLIREQIVDRLKKGKNIGVFAEEKPSYQMQEDGAILRSVLKKVLSMEVPFQIVPVSVSYEGGFFVSRFSKPIQSGVNHARDAQAVIAAIASKLPLSMRPSGL